MLSILILCLYFAFAGQAWNIMTGFAGQLSLGHSLYVGIGAYVSAMFFVKFGVNPWLGALGAIAACTVAGAIIGFLAFRFGVGGVYFAILTIAFAEFTRIGFDHLDWLGGSGGLFIPVDQPRHDRPREPARIADHVLSTSRWRSRWPASRSRTPC